MGTRLELQTLLESLMDDSDERECVYFQPPETVRMTYPCIVYALDRIDTRYANNLPYRHKKAYTVTVIDRDPDSDIPDKVGNLPSSSFSRKFTNDNLNHWAYRLYF